MSLGVKLVEQRKKHGFSQEQLADKMGISRQAISRWEAEDTLPDANNLKKISELLHVSIDDLLENSYSQEEKRDGLEKAQGTRKGSTHRWPMFLSIFLMAFGLLGILTFYVLSTQIPATEMRPDPIKPNVVSLETNDVIPVPGVLYSPQKVYSFFPFLDTYHLEGIAIGLVGLMILGLFLLICSVRKKTRGILKSHVLP